MSRTRTPSPIGDQSEENNRSVRTVSSTGTTAEEQAQLKALNSEVILSGGSDSYVPTSPTSPLPVSESTTQFITVPRLKSRRDAGTPEEIANDAANAVVRQSQDQVNPQIGEEKAGLTIVIPGEVVEQKPVLCEEFSHGRTMCKGFFAAAFVSSFQIGVKYIVEEVLGAPIAWPVEAADGLNTAVSSFVGRKAGGMWSNTGGKVGQVLRFGGHLVVSGLLAYGLDEGMKALGGDPGDYNIRDTVLPKVALQSFFAPIIEQKIEEGTQAVVKNLVKGSLVLAGMFKRVVGKREEEPRAEQYQTLDGGGEPAKGLRPAG